MNEILLAELQLWQADINEDIYSGNYNNRVNIQRKYKAIEKTISRIKLLRKSKGLSNYTYFQLDPPKGGSAACCRTTLELKY